MLRAFTRTSASVSASVSAPRLGMRAAAAVATGKAKTRDYGTYRAPQKDMGFLMNEVHQFEAHYGSLQTLTGPDMDMADMIVAEAAKFAETSSRP